MVREPAAARALFVDTSVWYALIDRRDVHHDAVAALVAERVRAGARLVTTDYVLDESCTLAKARAGSVAALRLLDLAQSTAALQLEWVGPDGFAVAADLFRKYHDHGFSFTDCTSFALMRARDIGTALTTDRHFVAAGFEVLPGG